MALLQLQANQLHKYRRYPMLYDYYIMIIIMPICIGSNQKI
jgi:hypothetical protein